MRYAQAVEIQGMVEDVCGPLSRTEAQAVAVYLITENASSDLVRGAVETVLEMRKPHVLDTGIGIKPDGRCA